MLFRLQDFRICWIIFLIFVPNILNLVTPVTERGQGIPGLDFPAYSAVPPRLHFSCQNRIGYFADPETNCQVWHWCVGGGYKYSFLCPNGTVFNQLHRVCDWWFNVDCALAPNLYNINEDLYIYRPRKRHLRRLLIKKT